MTRLVRVTRVLAAVLLVAGAVMAAAPPDTAQASGSVTAAPSALTRRGTGPFSSLSVTVSQTANLVDQKVLVSWSGGSPTLPGGNQFALNYLQIMQCWGDTAPDATQCQYGASTLTDPRGGAFTRSRQLNYGLLVDPLVGKLTAPTYVPFRSVTGDTVVGNTNQFFDSNTTNEVPFGETSPDGTGQVWFETQTAFEAPGLGCGQARSAGGSSTPRGCWLVVVPRGEREVDGTLRGTSSTDQLQSSPLSPTNWAQRIVFPLQFAPLGSVCPIGAHERGTVGVESLADAVTRWQPALCQHGGAVFGYSQVPDSVARRQVTSSDPGLVFLNGPLSPVQNPSGVPLTYAPVALSGVSIAFNIDYQAAASAPPSAHALDGLQMTSMKLSPRLVAKLLTQSYVLGALTAPYLTGNPNDLVSDPDFLRLNPEYKGLNLSVPTVLVPLGNSDVNQLVWKWIDADREARAFLAGYPDPWGMRVNPFYQGLSTDLTSFPKQDPYCQKLATAPIPLCTLDANPYTSSLHDGARSTSRGDTLARTVFDAQATPPAYKKAPLQLPGLQSVMTLADTVTAQRYGLAVAQLENSSGQFVAPSSSGLLAGYRAMQPSGAPGVLSPNPMAGGTAYPLTLMTYAATAAGALTPGAAKDYAALVRYAAGPGQSIGFDVGQLPLGYVPLPLEQRALALRAAASIADRVVPTSSAPSLPSTQPAPPPAVAPGLPSSLTAPAVPAPRPHAAPVPAPPPVLAGPASVGPEPVLRTAALLAGSGRFAVVCLLVVGGAAAGVGAALPMWARRRGSPRVAGTTS